MPLPHPNAGVVKLCDAGDNEQVRGLIRIVLLLAATLLIGCGDDSARELRDWTFVGPSGQTSSTTLPTHLNALLPSASSHYALRTEVTLDPSMRGHDLVLVIPRFLGQCTLVAAGLPATSIEPEENVGYRARGPHAWRIPTSATTSGVLSLELDVEHTWTRSGWQDTVPRLTSATDGGRAYVFLRDFNQITAALSLCAAFAGYLYLIVYLTDRRRTNYGWFAVTGLTGIVYSLFHLGVLAHLGRFETIATAYGVILATGAEIYFTAAHFSQPPPSRAWPVLAGGCALAIIASIGYFTSTQIGGPATLVFVIPAIFSQVVLLVRLARKRPRPPSLWMVLGGWAILALLAIPDFVAWAGFGELLGGASGACLGICMIALLQTATISRAHTKALREADDLAAERQLRIRELETQKREVEVLNDELRRQVGARSLELASAISRLADAPVIEGGLKPGDVVDGRYDVVRAIGAGAGGSVYLVTRRSDGAELAMKVVPTTKDRSLIARLAREAHLVAEVKHENVIAIVDVDVAASGFLYIVMEYIAGATLRDHKTDFGRVDWALEVLAQIAAGLESVHARGIVHRDLKPANVLLVSNPGQALVVKIADFGIAGLAGAEGDGESMRTISVRQGSSNDWNTRPDEATPLELTQTGVLLGTPLYMAPETVGGAKNAPPSVDLFSFGVIAHELLRGIPPFSESPALAQLRGHNVEPPPPLASVQSGVPEAVSKLVDRCLSFDPAERPSAAEAMAILRAALVESAA